MAGRRLWPWRSEQRYYSPAEVVWGVPLRPGFSDDDDPRAHEGVAQHAFEIGSDRRAICGFEPPVRATPGRSSRPMLALASSVYNPRCRKCSSMVVVFTDEETR
jgi:hypothetical protein